MAFSHGTVATFVFDSGDLSAFSDNISWNRTRVAGDVTNFASGGDTEVLGGLRSATFTVTGKFDATATTGTAAILNKDLEDDVGDPKAFTIEQDGVGKITGSAILNGYTESIPVGDIITWSADFTTSGAITTTNQV